MMKRTILHTLTALVALMTLSTLTSCREEIYSESPVYDTLFFSADSIDFKGAINNRTIFSPGQTAYVGVTIASPGAYITRAEQTWVIRGFADNSEVLAHKTVIGPVGQEPTWKFTAPMEPGEYSVSFNEKYSFSAQQSNGTIFGQSSTLNGKFRVR